MGAIRQGSVPRIRVETFLSRAGSLGERAPTIGPTTVSVPIFPSLLIPYPFSEEQNELMPTLQPKRRVIMRRCGELIDAAVYEAASTAHASQVVHTGG